MKKGKVKFYDSLKGFGFIAEEGSNREYFVHSTGLVDRVNNDDVVTFDLKEGKKGMNATQVRLAQ